jgi:ribonuclease PH
MRVMRAKNRKMTELRPIQFETNYVKHAEGSCFVKMGDTWVLCTASIEDKVPPFLEKKGEGWVTAEYAMLPRATHTRTRRESTTGKPSGRSQEIQRLIGRALRACVHPKLLGERTITIDCDVLQADGGTRTASINGGYVALALAIQGLKKTGQITTQPIHSFVAAVSLGIKEGEILLDLDYNEDSSCDVDMNVVMLDANRIVELQGTAEKIPFTQTQALKMVEMASKGITDILKLQKSALEKA